MGQRTHFVIVAEDKIKNKGRVTILYNSWGIGRNMPISLMSLVGNLKGYSCSMGRDFLNAAMVDFHRLGYVKEKEIEYMDGVALDKDFRIQNFSDWRDIKIAGEYMSNFDNNNGCMFVFVTLSEDKWGTSKIKKEIAWMIGSEDAYRYLNGIDGTRIERNPENKKLGGPYEKWLTTNQWMSLDVNNTWWGKDPEFKELFNRFLAYFEILPLNKPRNAKNAA